MVWGKPRRGFNEEQAYDFVSQTNANVTGLTKSVRDTPDGDVEVWSEVGAPRPSGRSCVGSAGLPPQIRN